MGFTFSDYSGYYVVVVKHDGSGLKCWRNGVVKDVKVVPVEGLAYHIQKTQIKADGGAHGLYELVHRSCREGFGYGPTVLHKIFEYMK